MAKKPPARSDEEQPDPAEVDPGLNDGSWLEAVLGDDTAFKRDPVIRYGYPPVGPDELAPQMTLTLARITRADTPERLLAIVPDLWAYGSKYHVLPVLAEAWFKHWKTTLGTEPPQWTAAVRGEKE